ncbi:MAG: hypothetical protein J5877_00280 [Clostridia bacterium]|nr:hypothetical protein [Clostridia bacterium]
MEMIVTLTIMLIASTLAINLIILIIKNYRRVEYRWMIQTITEYVANSFSTNTNREAFCTADRAEIMYDETLVDNVGSTTAFSLPSCPELGTIQFDSDHNISVNPTQTDENLELLKNGYIYLLTFDRHFYQVSYRDLLKITENKDSEGNVTSTTITWKPEDEKEPIKPVSDIPSVKTEQDTDVALDVWFEIALNPRAYDSTINQESEGDHDSYLATALTASVSGLIQNKVDNTIQASTDYVVSFNLDNMDGENQKINFDPSTKRLSTEYAAGWTYASITATGESTNLPTDAERVVVLQSEGVNKVEAENISARANVVRYHSVNTKRDLSDTIGDTYVPSVSGTVPFCFLTSLTIGLDRQSQILEPLRDFRDTVLRGNTVGEWMIDKYYDWSPAFISLTEKAPALKGAFRLAAEGLAAFATVAVE